MGSSDLHTTKQEAAVSEMVRVLHECGKQFSHYEELHVQKNPPDYKKAEVNHTFSVMCYEALKNWEASK